MRTEKEIEQKIDKLFDIRYNLVEQFLDIDLIEPAKLSLLSNIINQFNFAILNLQWALNQDSNLEADLLDNYIDKQSKLKL